MKVGNTVLAIFIAVCLLQTACSLKEIKAQSGIIDSAASISGVVKNETGKDGQIYIKVYEQVEEAIALKVNIAANSDGSYRFALVPGKYLVAAYVDVNDNQTYEHDEPAASLSDDNNQVRVIELHDSEAVELPSFVISNDSIVVNDREVKQAISRVNQNVGKVFSLDNPMFARENANMGMWKPFDFIDNVDGGLLFLEEYDPSKQPVLFVHGIMGTPIEFQAMVEALDKTKYQAWVLYYPSGVRLDMVSDYMIRALNQLHDQYRFDDIYLIAHSMGGLMVRSFLIKHQTVKASYSISKHMTINSPLYGMDSALSGVEHSPIVVPVWRDVASNSDYVQRIHQWEIPDSTQYALVFSYLKGEEGDGVVPLSSQISLSLQDQAEFFMGFQAQHAGVLKDPEFTQRFIEFIDMKK